MTVLKLLFNTQNEAINYINSRLSENWNLERSTRTHVYLSREMPAFERMTISTGPRPASEGLDGCEKMVIIFGNQLKCIHCDKPIISSIRDTCDKPRRRP